MATATIETLAKPEDAGEDFVVFRDVPIFDEHEMVEEHPVTGARKVVRYTRGVLQSMADNMNRRITQSGDPLADPAASSGRSLRLTVTVY